VDLLRRDANLRRNLRHLADRAAAGAARRLWEEAIADPVHTGPPVWVHGDLHPANLVTRNGLLAGVIDWGDLCGGDPAADLQIAWTWFDGPERRRLWAELRPDPGTVARARANALAHAVAVVANSADNPRMAAIGARTLRAVLDDPDR
jgi:aminoglycoside phosphotransferase (APT) family kinase protein